MIATSVSQLTQEPRSSNRDNDVILNISDDQKAQYLSQNIDSGKSKDKNNEKNSYYILILYITPLHELREKE